MGVKITARYSGKKNVELRHIDSGSVIVTDAPKDNQGEGLMFSPTDLVPAALSSCILTTLQIVAERDGVDLGGMHCEIEKIMSADTPRRIVSLPLTLHLPHHLTAPYREKYERVAHRCPVHLALHPSVEVPLTILYDA